MRSGRLRPYLSLVLLLGAEGRSEAQPPSLDFGISLSRLADGDSVVVVATVTNTGSAPFTTWGTLVFTGGFVASADSERKMRARDDSLRSANRDTVHFRCRTERGPSLYILPNLDPPGPIRLEPGASYRDTLGLRLHRSQFEKLPGIVEIRCEFLTGPRAASPPESRWGGHAMKVAVPVP